MEDIEIFKEVSQKAKEFLKSQNLDENLLDNLLKEGDWSFLIKISALLESSSTDVLTTFLGKEIEDELSYLDYGHSKSGKITLMKKLDIIYEDQAKVLRYILEIRNKLAHKIENVNFTFDEYIKNLDDNQRKNFIKYFGSRVADVIEIKGHKVKKRDFVLENPKMCILFTVQEIIACMYLSKQEKDIKNSSTIILEPEMVLSLVEKYKNDTNN